MTRAVTGGPAHFRSCTQVGKARGPSCGAIPMRGWHHIQSWRSPTHWHALLPVIYDASLPHSYKSAHKRSIGINQNQIQKRRHWPVAGGHTALQLTGRSCKCSWGWIPSRIHWGSKTQKTKQPRSTTPCHCSDQGLGWVNHYNRHCLRLDLREVEVGWQVCVWGGGLLLLLRRTMLVQLDRALHTQAPCRPYHRRRTGL